MATISRFSFAHHYKFVKLGKVKLVGERGWDLWLVVLCVCLLVGCGSWIVERGGGGGGGSGVLFLLFEGDGKVGGMYYIWHGRYLLIGFNHCLEKAEESFASFSASILCVAEHFNLHTIRK